MITFDHNLEALGINLEVRHLRVSDSKNGARLEWWVKSLYKDLYHWMRLHY